MLFPDSLLIHNAFYCFPSLHLSVFILYEISKDVKSLYLGKVFQFCGR
jgi:hypothetical protein